VTGPGARRWHPLPDDLGLPGRPDRGLPAPCVNPLAAAGDLSSPYRLTLTAGGVVFTPAPVVRIERREYGDGQRDESPTTGPPVAPSTSIDHRES
jgi:hypothetical protein